MINERFTYERVGKESIRVFDNGKKMHPIGGVVNTLNEFDRKNKQLEIELQRWKDTAEALQEQLAHEIAKVLVDD